MALYKIDSSGNEEWSKHLGGSNDEEGYVIEETFDGGFIVYGYTSTYTVGQSDIALRKFDSSDAKDWFKHLGGTNNEIGYGLCQTSEGGYAITGFTETYTNGGKDMALYNLDSNGSK